MGDNRYNDSVVITAHLSSIALELIIMSILKSVVELVAGDALIQAAEGAKNIVEKASEHFLPPVGKAAAAFIFFPQRGKMQIESLPAFQKRDTFCLPDKRCLFSAKSTLSGG